MKNLSLTRKLTLMAMLIAVEVVLEIIEKSWFVMPQGGTISISIVAILLASYILGVKEGLLVGIGGAFILFILGQVTWYGIYSYFLDYLLAMAVCGLAALFKNVYIKKGDKTYPIYIGVIVACIFKYIGHFLSGWLLFAEYAEGNVILYSITYNATYMIPTLIASYLLFSLVYPHLIRFKR